MLHLEDDSEDDDELDSSDVREVYKQLNNNMRAFITLRFRHFATFSVIMAFVVTVAFGTERLSAFTLPILIFGTIITILFWCLDQRTGNLLRYYAESSRSLEKKFLRNSDYAVGDPPRSKILTASRITNLIFLMILAGWVGFIYILYSQSEAAPEDRQVEHNILKLRALHQRDP